MIIIREYDLPLGGFLDRKILERNGTEWSET